MKETVKEKLGGRPAKLNEKKGDRQKTKETFFVGRATRKFCSGGDKMRSEIVSVSVFSKVLSLDCHVHKFGI